MRQYKISFPLMGKKLYLIVFIMITKSIFAQQVTPDSSFHIYLLMGQSNMAGRGYLTDSLREEHNDRVLVLNKDMQWIVAHHPLHYDKPNDDGVGPGLAFGIKMAEADTDTSVKIGLVPCAVGGTPIEHWKAGAYDEATGTHPYDDAVQRIREAMKRGVISGIIWHQGESDCTDALAPDYMPQLLNLISNIRTVVQNPDLPFVAGELGRFYGPHDLINAQLPSLLQKLKNVGVVSSQGLTDRGDALHFDAVSAETLGRRYADKMLEIQHFQPVDVKIDSITGTYNITSNLSPWTFSGSTGSPLSNVQNTQGSDEAGGFTKVSFSWDHGNKAGAIRWYKNSPVIIFTLTLPKGGSTSLAGFPAFNKFPDSLYHFSYYNDHFAAPQFTLNETSTPWLLFDRKNNACIISPASNFMVAKIEGDGIHSITSTINEEITAFPDSFSYSTIMVLDNGIRDSWDNWGTSLRALYHRQYPDRDADTLLKYYGYWTDNGADYYYNYDTTIGYESTLLKLRQYYQDQQIPMGYMQLDSWWYEKSNYSATGVKGPGYKNSSLPRGPWNLYGGLMEYKADPFVFPDGLTGFQKQLGVPMATHNRWIDPSSPYQQQYQISGIMSTDPRYWADIMDYIKNAGVTCYEQDWLDYIYRGSPAMQSTLNVADSFTDNMAGAAASRDINLQYCMAMPRYFLQGLKYNNLTTIRTSEDIFKQNKWQNFLFTSQLAFETGAIPWSDVFKSSELGNMILSVLSSGPVGTGDAIGKENKNNIMLACRTDGQLVRPDVPILPLDKSYTEKASGDSLPLLAYTYTKHNNITTDYLFAFCNDTGDAKTFTFTPDEIGMTGNVVVYNPITKAIKAISSQTSFTDEVAATNYNYYIIAPITTSGIAFLGDSGKIAATGKKRITDIEETDDGLKVDVLFADGEKQVVLRGYSERYVRASKGDVKMDPVSRVFSLVVTKPENSDTEEIIFTPTDVADVPAGAFSTVWKTDNPGGAATQIQFNATGNSFNVHWQDLFDSTNTGDTVGSNGANTISFPSASTYVVSISPGSGSFTGFAIGSGSPQKLLSIEQWGDIKWSSFASAYSGAINMVLNAADTPVLADVANMSSAFKNCSSLATDPAMGKWYTGNVTDMDNMFNGASAFNQDISNWNTGRVTNMSYMFNGAKAFNQPVGNWNIGNVTNVSNMFNGARSFDQPLSSWNIANVANIGHLFQSAVAFNQPVGNWNLNNVTNMAYMFYDAESFNQDISSWNTPNVVNMVSMFQKASSFNQDIGGWNLKSIASAKNNDGSLVNMLSGSGMDCDIYSRTLKGWAAAVTTPAGLSLGASGLSYDSAYAQASHDTLVDMKNWAISGDMAGHCSVTLMPVILTAFNGLLQQGIATLQWRTGVEINSNHFEIEASQSFKKGPFTTMGTINAKGSGNIYIFNVPQPGATAYYRLKMVDNDNAFTYSDIIALSQNGDTQPAVYPNPASERVNIVTGHEATIRIYNPAGCLLLTQALQPGANSVDIHSLSAGVYFCDIDGTKMKLVKK